MNPALMDILVNSGLNGSREYFLESRAYPIASRPLLKKPLSALPFGIISSIEDSNSLFPGPSSGNSVFLPSTIAFKALRKCSTIRKQEGLSQAPL
eukprot:Gb_29732 [translate_table: standard]